MFVIYIVDIIIVLDKRENLKFVSEKLWSLASQLSLNFELRFIKLSMFVESMAVNWWRAWVGFGQK